MRYPPAPCNKGRECVGRKPNGGRFHFTVVDEICIPQTRLPEKLIYLQQIKFAKNGRVELRLCYYIIGKRPAMRGRWVFGQFATMVPVADFRRIVRMAHARGWL